MPSAARRRARRWPWLVGALLVLLVLPLVLAGAVGAALWRGLHDEAGTRWWLRQAALRVPGLQIEAPRGALLGADAEFSLARLVLLAGRHTVRIDGLRASGLQASAWSLRAPYVHVGARALAAQQIAVDSAPAAEPEPPAAAPPDLRLPLTARIDSLRIETLRLSGLAQPLQSISARLEAGATHRADALQLRWNGLQLQGAARIDAAAPTALQASAELRRDPLAADGALPAAARDLVLTARADGPLAAFDLQAALALQAQRLDAAAQVTPFTAAPVRTLDARFEQLDLARLLAPFDVSTAPTTALSGTLQVQLAAGQPLAVTARIDNALPGRWSAQRLPLRQLDVAARGTGQRWEIERARASLASDARTAAGQIDATGRIDGARAEASVALDGVLLQGLDARAPAFRLNGPIDLQHTAAPAGGLGQLGIDARLSGALVPTSMLTSVPSSVPTSTRTQTPAPARVPGAARGRAARAPVPAPLRETVRLAVKGTVGADQLVIEALSAQAGAARLQGSGRARRAGAAWHTEADLTLAAFDPTLWLTGEPTAAWRRARNVLNGRASLKAEIADAPAAATSSAGAASAADSSAAASSAAPKPPAAARAAPSAKPPAPALPAALAGLRGRLTAELTDSALGGQPLALSLQADADGRGALTARADARGAGNRARLDLALRSDASASASAADTLQLDIDAPALAGLAPVAQVLGLGPLAGALRAEARADGPLGAWLFGAPAAGALVTRGSLALDGLQAGALQLARADGTWDLTFPGAPASLAPAAAAAPSAAAPASAARGTAPASKPGATASASASSSAPASAAGSTSASASGSAPALASGAAPGSTPAPALARAALKAKIDVVRLQLPSLLVPRAALRLDGTLAEHRASLSAALQAPASGTQPAPTALDLQLGAHGAWQAGVGSVSVSRWRGRIDELALRPERAGAGAAAEPSALLLARDVDLDIERGSQSLRASAAPGRAEVLGAVLRWTRARWERDGEAPPRIDLQAEAEPFLLAPLLARLQPDFGWEGDLRLAARADFRSEPAVSARVEVTRSGGDLQVAELGTVQRLGLRELRLDLNAQDGLWRMTQVVDGETLGRLAGAQTVRTDARRVWPPADAPVEGALRLQVEQLSTWGAWVPAGWRLGGALDGVLRLAGRFGAPELIGELSGRQLALRNALEGVALSDGVLDARFDGGTARLDTLRFQAGDGTLRASGDARLGQNPQAQLTLVAERAAVLARVDRRVVVSGQASMRIDPERVRIDGDLRADEGLIDISSGDAPTLGDDVTVRRRSAASTARTPGAAGTSGASGTASTSNAPNAPESAAPATAPPRPPREVDLQLAVNLGERFRLRGKGIDTRLAGDLKLTTPAARLTAYGEIRTERGTYAAYGQNLEIERGVITFVGDIANPRLDIQAVRAKSDARVGVIVGGSAQAPRIRLFSEPELPATDKLALLVTGRSYDSLAGSETLVLQRAAMALLAGDGGGSSERFDIARALRLDELSVRQTDGAVRDTVLTLGKQISERVYVGYERGLSTAAGNFQLIYRIAQRFTLRAQSGEDPGVDLIWVFRWN